jgi:hypothetical protein
MDFTESDDALARLVSDGGEENSPARRAVIAGDGRAADTAQVSGRTG